MRQCVHYFKEYQRGHEVIMAYCELFGHSCFKSDWLKCIYYYDEESHLMNLLNQRIIAIRTTLETEKKKDEPDKARIRMLEDELKICLRNVGQ